MWGVLREVWSSFRFHDGRLISGAVAFYVLLAIAPVGVIALVVAGWVLGSEAAHGELTRQLTAFMGKPTAAFVSQVIESAREPGASGVATLASLAFLVYAATRVFVMLRAALNHIWGVRTTVSASLHGPGRKVLGRRMLAFGMVLMCGAAIVLLAVLRVGTSRALGLVPKSPVVTQLSELGQWVAVLTLLVALIFRWLPDAHVAWVDVILGALVTAVFSVAGSLLIGVYFAEAGVVSTYGAAGSFVVLMIWVYYTAQVFFLGAEFTRAWAEHMGRRVTPLEHAESVKLSPDQSPIDY
ncbi:MAG: YihY/virulence factor BrkB family protein [Myxococcales bacterium]|nr:YihY/virulence factor BrkB family protein [Myxococcales bacterium]